MGEPRHERALTRAHGTRVSHERVQQNRRKRLTCRDIAEGERWGETRDSAWFHVQGRVPAAWAGALPVRGVAPTGVTPERQPLRSGH